MNLHNLKLALLFIAAIFLSSCEKVIVNPSPKRSALNNFQLMWKEYDSHYGLFLVKQINWDSIYTVNLPLAKAATSDAELYPVLTSMLANLNDKHVSLYTTDRSIPDFTGGYNGPIPAQEDFLFSVVQENYLTEYSNLSEDIGYGMLPNNIGYVHFSSFKDDRKKVEKFMDKIISGVNDTKGLIIDIRDHSGGSDHLSKYIAGRFAKEKKLFMTSKKRNGPNHNDFEQTYSWYVEPEGTKQYTKPIVLLTSSRTISAGETFTLAMKENDNVTQLGDTTAGAFSDEIFTELPNGWLYSISVGDYRASDGKSYEGIGISPQLFSKNKKSDLLIGKDIMLEKAIQLLK